MVINRVIDNAAVAVASLTRAPVVAARAAGPRPTPQSPAARARRSSASSERVLAPSGRPGPTASPCANSTTTTPSSPPSTRTRATTSRRSSPSPSTSAPAARTCPRHRHRLRDPDRPGQGDLPAQAQDRPRRPPRPVGRRRHRHPARPRRRDDLPGRRPGAAHHHRHPAVPQGRDLHLEGARPGVRRQDGRRGRRPRDARRDLPGADLRGRGRRHRLAARRPGRLLRRCRCPTPARPSAPSSTRTRRSTRPSTRRRRGSTSPASSTASTPRLTRPGQRRASVLIKTSHHTHYVIGSGANDPQKYDPTRQPRDARPLDPVHLHRRAAGRRLAPRRLLRARARRPRRHRRAVAQGHHRRGPGVDPPLPLRRSAEKAFGGRVEITLDDGTVITDEIAVADAHPLGARPFAREQYVNKFRTLAAGARRRRGDRAVPRRSPQRLPELGRRRAGPAQHQAADRRARPRAPHRRDSSDAVLEGHPGAEARPLPRAPRLRRPRCSSPARSTRSRRGSSRRRASTASTSPAPCWPPTSACPTSA